jgi:hypothetical protein
MFTRTRKIARVALVAVVAFALAACGAGGGTNGGAAPALVGRGQLIGATQGGTVGVTGLLALIGVVNARSLVPLVSIPLYPVSFYRVTYQTPDPAGNLTVASGLLLVPNKGPGRISPLLSWQHATLTQETQAPSYADGTTTGTPSEAQLGFISASLGYIVIMPDYLGFAAAKSIFHPYVQASTLASATIDMIRASKTFLSQSGIGYNTQLFLGGYSEGGYATLATQREMETNLSTEFAITASEPGSGPYDVTNTAVRVFGAANIAGITDAGAVAFLLKSYDLYYNNPSQLATYFTAGTVLNCVNADFTSAPTYGTDPTLGTFDRCIGGTTVTAGIFNSAFLTSFNAGGDPTLRAAFAQNDIYNWAPKARTWLFYSPGDDVVPPLSTTNAYNAMVAKGALQVQTVQCVGVTPANHINCATPFVLDLLVNFGLRAQNL